MLRAAGWHDAERGQQRAGGANSPDVKGGPPGVHFEVKRTEALRLVPALEQAEADAGARAVPIVAWRPNGARWACLLRAEDMLQLLWLAERGAKGLGYSDLSGVLAIVRTPR